MSVQDFGRPALPLREEPGQPLDQIQLSVEQLDGRRRRAGSGLEGHDLDLAPLVRAIEREEECDNERDHAQATHGGHHHDDPGCHAHG